MTEPEFDVLYQEYYVKRRVIQAMARKLAKDDPDLYDDLVQVGLFTLWRLDVSKAKSNKDSWIRQAMKFKMIDHLAEMDPRKYTSLDAHIEKGFQLEDTVDGIRLTVSPMEFVNPWNDTPMEYIALDPDILEDGLDASA